MGVRLSYFLEPGDQARSFPAILLDHYLTALMQCVRKPLEHTSTHKTISKQTHTHTHPYRYLPSQAPLGREETSCRKNGP